MPDDAYIETSVTAEPIPAAIYCRVSSTKQKTQGAGLASQEHRCRQYAEPKGYDVEMVFPDDASGGGTFLKRPGMVAMLSYLDAQPHKKYRVVFDDLKRLARDTQFHIALRQEFDARDARVECLNFTFEETPEGQFVETMMAATGELERKQNRRQTVQKMKARIEKGYYVFSAPVGYRYERNPAHGKILVRDEPLASIVQEALEGFAIGRFQTKAEVQRFLEDQRAYPKSTKTGHIHPQRIQQLLTRSVYAGIVEAPKWNVSPRKGHHEPIISVETYEKIQTRLNGKTVKAAMRLDINEAFPLRGFVQCSCCGQRLTASWSRSKTGKRHAYYWCKTRGCSEHRKSIRRADIEGAVEDVLASLQPQPALTKAATAMFRRAWHIRTEQAKGAMHAAKEKLNIIDRKIESLLDRIINAEQTAAISAYERKTAGLEREKLILQEKAEKPAVPNHTFEDLFELAMHFLASPWDIWQKGGLEWKRTVLNLAFVEPISYCREKGIRTPEITLPFKVLGEHNMQFLQVADRGGFEPPTP